jgi:poly-beta-1,6-N-acetyl-D-glucosamine synthase
LEVLLIDDHSDDHSFKIAEEFIIKNRIKNFRLLSLSEADSFSKKSALKKGIENSRGKLIVTTDADCTFQKNWLTSLVRFYEQRKSRMISAPVVSGDSKGFFAKLQTLDFLSLVASGAGAMSANTPIMANGANLCFERSLYDELNGYNAHNHYASGDDVFFLLEAKKLCKHTNEICFLKNPESIVITKGPRNLKEFMSQRIRWASKSTAYKDSLAVFTAMIVFLFTLSIPVLLICGFIDSWFAAISAILFAGKLVVDLPLMFSAARFIGKPKLIWYYLPMQLIYPFYIISVAVLSLFIKFEWKGRKSRK